MPLKFEEQFKHRDESNLNAPWLSLCKVERIPCFSVLFRVRKDLVHLACLPAHNHPVDWLLFDQRAKQSQSEVEFGFEFKFNDGDCNECTGEDRAMSKLIFKVIVGAALAIGLAAQPSGYGFAQDATKGETKARAKSVSAKSGEAKSDAAAEPKAKKPLTAQQQKMKDCGAKWQEEKKTKGVKGREAWNKFRSACLQS